MRTGYNPNKDFKEKEEQYYYHKIIIPLYIPNFEGYFTSSFEIFKLSHSSLKKTIHKRTSISIISNGSCKEVNDFLKSLLDLGEIHELIINTLNIGKLNSILKGISGSNETFLTITDADVLFLNNWQSAVENIFVNMPKAGVVCTTAGSRSYGKDLGLMYFDYFFKDSLRFRKVKDKQALIDFTKSIGAVGFYNDVNLEYYLTLKSNHCEAVAGAAHFTATYRRDVFNKMDIKYSDYKLGGNSEFLILDEPPLKQGFYRYSTIDNFTYHMGNVLENWMREKEESLLQNNFMPSRIPVLQEVSISKIKYRFVDSIFNRIVFNKRIIQYVLVIKGLSFKDAKKYLKK